MKTLQLSLALFVLVFMLAACGPTARPTPTPNAAATQTELAHLNAESLYLGMDSFCKRAPQDAGVQDSPRMFSDSECGRMMKQARDAELHKGQNLTSSLSVNFYNGMQLFCISAPETPVEDAPAKYTVEQCQDMVQQARDVDLFNVIIVPPTATPPPSGF